MKFQGGPGGDFVKFTKIGDRAAGVVVGVRQIKGKFGDQTVLDLDDNGAKASVALGPKALQDNYAQAVAAVGTLVGKRVVFLFEREYQSKRGGNPGKDISIEVLDGGAATPAQGAADVEAAYKVVVDKRGEEPAKTIRKAVETVEKDPAKQAAMLLKAVA